MTNASNAAYIQTEMAKRRCQNVSLPMQLVVCALRRTIDVFGRNYAKHHKLMKICPRLNLEPGLG